MKGKHRIGLLGLLIIPVILQACLLASVSQEKTKPDSVSAADAYAGETKALESLLKKSSKRREVIRAHLELAGLYRSWENPHRDYEKAFEHLAEYASMVPEADRPPEVSDWLAALKRITELSTDRNRLRRELSGHSGQIKSLSADNRELKSDKEKLEQETRKLREQIESLKNLDLQVEEKRRTFK